MIHSKIISSNSDINLRGFNTGLVFIKPHLTGNQEVLNYIYGFFSKHNIGIASEQVINGSDINQLGLIDKHYSVQSFYAFQNSSNLILSADSKAEFEQLFNQPWDKLLSEGKIRSAAEILDRFPISPNKLGEKWMLSQSKKIRSSGFYIAKMNINGDDYYVINGFYPQLREKYISSNSRIHIITVNFPSMDWIDFRKLVGATNPKSAEENDLKEGTESIRGYLHQHAKELNIVINGQDNGVHSSASPLESLFEQMIWNNIQISTNPLAKLLLGKGLSLNQISFLQLNPLVNYQNQTRFLFDLVEDHNTQDTANIIVELFLENSER